MLSKRQLKELRYYRQNKYCKENGLFVVEGEKMAEEALSSGWSIRTVCATESWMATHRQPATIDQWHTVSAGELEMLSLMRNPNAVWMLVERQEADITALRSIDATLVLDHLQDPGNMGTIIRTADWFGIRHIVCSLDSVDCYNPKVVQSTMGGIFRTKVIYTDIVDWLTHCGTPVYGAVLGGEPICGTTKLSHPCTLVIGNESQGISPAVAACLTQRITIPNIGGSAESLNAASAAAVLIALLALPEA